MKKKRDKLTLVKFTAAGYGGYTGNTKITNTISINVIVVGNKNIEERIEKKRKKIEIGMRAANITESEIRVKYKIKESFYIDGFIYEDEPINK